MIFFQDSSEQMVGVLNMYQYQMDEWFDGGGCDDGFTPISMVSCFWTGTN